MKPGTPIRFITGDNYSIEIKEDFAYFLDNTICIPSKQRGLYLISLLQSFYNAHTDDSIAKINQQIQADIIKHNSLRVNNHDRKLTVKHKKPGYIYFMQAEKNIIKIGYSKDPQSRLASIQKTSSIPIVLLHTIKTNDMVSCELFFHNKFIFNKLHREWFILSDDNVTEILQINEKMFEVSL